MASGFKCLWFLRQAELLSSRQAGLRYVLCRKNSLFKKNMLFLDFVQKIFRKKRYKCRIS